MPAIKIAFRLKSPDLAFGESFQARHQARVDRPLDDIDLAEFFIDVQANLKPGDHVTVVAFKDRSWQQVMEWQDAIITSQRQETPGGRLVTRAMWKDGTYGKLKPEAQAAPVNAPKLKLDIKKEFGGGFTVQDEKGHVVERFKTRKEAEDYIDNLNGKAVKAA